MGTVLPPWKLELIEKKKKRLEQEKAKEQERIDRYSNIPEWKRTILSKRKGFQSSHEEALGLVRNESKPNAYAERDQIQNSAPSYRKISRQNSSEGRSLKSDIDLSNEKEVPKEILKNGDAQGHSFVTDNVCVSQSDKQRTERQRLTNSHPSSEDEDEGRVLYEHIKTPSELKKLYELRVAKRKALEETQNKEPPSSTRTKPLNDSQSHENSFNQINNETLSNVKYCTELKHNGALSENEIIKQTQGIKLVEEQSLQASIPPATNEINHGHAIVDNNRQDTKELQNGEDTSSEIHVGVIRSKFGPSGCFRRRSASSENLLKSSSEDTTPLESNKPRPSPLNKRWSMISLARENEDSDDHGNLSRARSLSDMRNEPPQSDFVYLRHRASVSHDIEHRIHELLHHGSAFDDNASDEWNEDQMTTKEKPHYSPIPTKDEESLKERRASWFNSEQVAKTTESIQISCLPQVKKSSYSQDEAKDYNEKPFETENDVSNHRPDTTVLNSTRKEIKEKEIIVNNAESNDTCQADLHESGSEVNNESADDQNSKGPSVHKLSALFGSSILKGNKNPKANKNVESKNDSSKQTKDTKETSRKLPWLKKSNISKVNNTTNSSGKETNFSFKGAQNLKPVQNKYEHKITGNVALVIGGTAKNSPPNNNAKKPATFSKPVNNGNKVSPSSIHATKKTSDCEITVIDVPDTSSHDIQVSAIDIPEAHSPTPVSVIDMPETKESELKVSVIDVPGESDSDSDSETSGSYEVNSGVFTFETDSSESRDDDDEEDDIDNVPVSYYGDSTYMKVPEVIFETGREDVKSILSSPMRKRKRKNKVAFHPDKLEKIHDYPSETCLQSHYDDMQKEQGGLSNYQPSSLQNVNLSVESLKPIQTDVISNEKVEDSVNVTYSDDGEGFSSSSGSSGALLF